MEKEHIKMAILKQEQTFRQQVHELHRVYRVQKHLMKEMQIVELNRAQTIAHTETRPKVENLYNDSGSDQQCYSYSDEKKPFAEDFDLELTLATGSSRSQKREQEKPSNSDSGATLSSPSTESELGRFRESNVTLRFQNESKGGFKIDEGRRHDEQLMQSPWLYQCLSLKMA